MISTSLRSERNAVNGCHQLVHTCGDLKSNETALIVSDFSTQHLGEQLAAVAERVTHKVIHKTIAIAAMHGTEPTPEVAALMAKADLIFGITKMSMAHTAARYQATLNGARYLSLPDYTLELLERAALYVNFRDLTTSAENLAQCLTHGKKARITTTLGTQLELSLIGRSGNAAPGWCFAKGTLASPPDAEANIPPLEFETEGVLVVDGSIPCQEIGLLSSPIRLMIERGKIVAMEGANAAILQTVFDRYENDNVRIAAEFGIGLNPAAELCGSMLEDEGCLGTIHIGFGSNSTIGGINKVPFHLDTIVRNATIFIDDACIMENGKFSNPSVCKSGC